MRSPVSITNIYRVILTLPLALFSAGIKSSLPVQRIDHDQAQLAQFDMLTTSSGWILLDKRLFKTSDAGQTWQEISPSIPADAIIQDVQFNDADTGWVLWTITNPEGEDFFQLAHTSDSGISWSIRSLAFFEGGTVASQAEKAEMGWFDSQTGWISVKQRSGSNFSIGMLFRTSDGGTTWSRSPLPVADHIDFHESQIGWAVGGPTGDQVFETRDGSVTWQNVGPDIPVNSLATAYLPFYSNGKGLLVMTTLGRENSLNVYALENFSDRWSPAGHVNLNVQPGSIPLSILDEQNFVAVIPGSGTIVRMINNELSVIASKDAQTDSIVQFDMVTPDAGWAKSGDTSCITASSATDQSASVTCSSNTRLLHTTDGGLTWQSLVLPRVQSDTVPPKAAGFGQTTIMNTLSNPGNTRVFIGQGFDKCEIPTLSQLQTWWNDSPYKTLNLYIGGSSRACPNSALSAVYLSQLYQQGWKFIPTWVGPQAPCTGFLSRISDDATIAYNQGVNEADLAVERLAELGLTFPDKTGSVIYYDIEHYGTETACRNAVNAFMNGWVSQIHARGNLAGVYGSTVCNTAISDFRSIANVPDVIWPARWYHNAGSGLYDPSASVWNLGSCIPNSAWVDHQRIRQYEGDHNETWGNLTLEIDINVLDGVVAIPYVVPMVESVTRTVPNPADAFSLHFSVKISESVTGVDSSDFHVTATGITGASVSTVSGSGDTYTVAVDTGLGNGTLRLDVIDNDSIKNASNTPLGGPGIENGNFDSGETYTILKSAAFADVSNSHWAWDWIERLYRAGITGGCGGSNFCPDSPVTRAQMAVFLERGIHGSSYIPPSIGANTGFNDVPADYWSAAWIKQLAVEGITGGCDAGKYCPDQPVTRAQMAVFLLKSKYGSSYSPPPVGASTGFNDVPTDYWAAAWIQQLAAEGITGGCGNGNYCPGNPATRAEMAVFLVKTFGLP